MHKTVQAKWYPVMGPAHLNVPASLDSLTQTMRSVMTHTGGSETEKFHTEAMIEHGLYVRSNQTGVSNTRAVPVGKRVEGVSDE